MLKTLLAIIAGAIWSLVVFTLGTALLFPTEAFEKRTEYAFQEFTQGGFLIDLTDTLFLGFGGISGHLEFYKGEKQRRRRRRSKASVQPTNPPEHLFTMEQFSLRLQVLPLLMGRLITSYDIAFGESSLEGSVGFSATEIFWDSDTEDFDLSLAPAIDMDDFSVDLAGEASLISDLVLSRTDPKESSGSLTLQSSNLRLLNGIYKPYTMDLMPANFSDSILKLEIEEGRAQVTEGRFMGDLMDAEIEGEIILKKKLSRSHLALKIRLKIHDEALDMAMKNMSTLKRARDDEGYFHFRGSGTLSRPRFVPDRTKSRGRAGSPAGVLGDSEVTRPSSRYSDEDAEERRLKRKDRIKKRRERMKERRRKRRERESESDDGAEDDQRRDLPGRQRRSQLDFDDMEPNGNQLPQDIEDLDFRGEDKFAEGDYPSLEDVEEDEFKEEEDPEEDENEPLDDLGYVNEE